MSLEISIRANADTNYNYDIFLSHSGHQKLFVHYLYRELQYASYKAFFDQDNEISLPKGSHLLLKIMNAIKSCKLAVVVISEGFITSLWPMMELEHLMAATHECIIYPVFYEIQPGDLVKEKKLKKWNKHWKDLAKKNQNQAVPIDISTWSQSLASLKLLAGTIIPVAASEQILFEKISEIVKHVCQEVPPPLFYHDPLIKGKERTVQAIQDCYKRILENCTEVGVLVLGVAGIAGSGKTTTCKTMVDYYNQYEFLGNSFLVELPTEEVQKEQLIQKFKIALETITRAQKLTKRITHIEQAYFLFSQVKKDYFIAIDNVCTWSADYVMQILEKVLANASYVTHKPKVMITSHSKALLEKIGVRTVINVPVLNKEEALDVLLSYGRCWKLYRSSQVEYKIHIESILNICYMKINGFHPLLLKTLGNIMCQTVGKDGYGWEECIHEMRSICIGLTEHQSGTTSLFQSKIEKAVIYALEANYSHLDDHLKKLFIDIAILYPRCIRNLQELSMLKDYQDITKVKLQVACNWLEYFGLWSVRRDCNNQIEIHDLYKALAKKEAKINGNFLVFLDGEVTIAPLSSLSKVTRIVNYGMPHKRSINVGNLKGLHFSELLLDRLEILDLDAKDIMILFDAWRYDNTRSATTFLLQYPFINLNNAMRRIIGQFYEWRNVDLQWRSDLCLSSLSILKLECGNSITRLDALGCALNLQSLTLSKCYALKSIKGVEKLKRLKELILGARNLGNHSLRTAYLNGCLELKKLIIIGFNQVKSLADLHCPHGLERLELRGNRNLVDVGDIGCFGQNLVTIIITNCYSLKEFPGVALPKLEELEVSDCEGLEGAAVLCEQNFPRLIELSFGGCPRLKAPLRISKAGGLQFLMSRGVLFNFFESTLGPDMTNLYVTVNREQFMFSNASRKENVTAISSLVNLGTLSIKVVDTSQADRECSNNPILSNLSFLSHLHGLEYLTLIGFDFIRSLEELSCLTNLQSLILRGCSHVENLPLPPNLSILTLEDCRSLRRLTTHDWSAIKPLYDLYVFHCPAFEWFQDSFRTLTKIDNLSLDYESCYGCSSIVVEDAYKVALDLSNVEYFIQLKLEGFPASSLSNLKWPKDIHYLWLQSMVSSCVAGSPEDDHGLQIDFSKVLFMYSFIFHKCCIPSISCIKWPTKLTGLHFLTCNEVRSLADFSCPTSLEELTIDSCRDLEETPDLSSLVNLRMIRLRDCPSLEQLPGYTPRTELELQIENCPRLKTTTNN